MYLGLDLGTSGVKALLIDASQQVVASATAPLEVSRPASGWSEQDPDSWVEATGAAIDALRRDHASTVASVRGIGLSGQMHGATLLDASNKVLRPCMLWNDTRAHEEAAALDALPSFRALSGNIVFPGFTAPKLAWVKKHEPEIFSKVAKVLLPKDYLRLWLTGEHVSEMSDAAGTSWLNVAERNWSEELLAATGLGLEQMPSLVEGSDRSGDLRSDLADRWGMGAGIAVAGGAGDNAASAIGLGTVEVGSAFVSLGTSGVLFAANDSYLPRPESAVHTFCHALHDTWHQMGVVLSATDSLNWWAGIAGSTAADLTAELGSSPTAPADIVFLPYLSGERTPHNDAGIRGSFIGLDHAHDRKTMTAAVLDGVAFSLRDSLEALRSAGTQLSSVMAVGGGARSEYWLQALANALDLPIELPDNGDYGAAFGAARLGLIAAEGGKASDLFKKPAIVQTFTPDAKLTDAYGEAYTRYASMYPKLK